jgi:hypothetical protein
MRIMRLLAEASPGYVVRPSSSTSPVSDGHQAGRSTSNDRWSPDRTQDAALVPVGGLGHPR